VVPIPPAGTGPPRPTTNGMRVSAAQRRATEQQQRGQPLVRPVSARPELKPSFRTPLDYRVRLMTAGACLTIEAVFDAYFDCRRVKRGTINQLRFVADLESNLVSLYEDLASGRYPGHGSPCRVCRTSLSRHRCLTTRDGRPRGARHHEGAAEGGQDRGGIGSYYFGITVSGLTISPACENRPKDQERKGRQRPGLCGKGHAARERN
jgi:hypothetical protein